LLRLHRLTILQGDALRSANEKSHSNLQLNTELCGREDDSVTEDVEIAFPTPGDAGRHGASRSA
jgi:hypothetical protein